MRAKNTSISQERVNPTLPGDQARLGDHDEGSNYWPNLRQLFRDRNKTAGS
jgi:hypothetical protein